MQKNIESIIFKKRKQKIVLISFIIFLTFLINLIFFNHILHVNTNFNNADKDLDNFSQNLESANGDSILFEGIQSALNITDNGNLYKTNQEVSLSNNEETSVTYYLDEEHDWNVSRIETSLNNIQDTREWVNNSGFIHNATVFSEDVDLYNKDPPGYPYHNYDNGLDEDPTDSNNIHSKLYLPGALAIRVHFERIRFEDFYDCVFIWNKYDKLCYCDTGDKDDFFSPWILGDGINITIGSSSDTTDYGYDIDRYEFVNTSSGFLDNLDYWGNNTNIDTDNYGSGWIGNNTAMYTSLYSTPYRYDDPDYPFRAVYFEDDYSEIYQNITIPRGKVVDAEINFAYYAEYAMESNGNYIYFAINNKEVYTIGLKDVVDKGRNQWHYSGKINLLLWINNSNIFNNPINNQNINISVGIMSGAWVSYSNYLDAFQQVIWFDNVSFTLTTIANSTQEGIDLVVKTLSYEENIIDGNEWGTGSLNLEGMWDSNPIILTFNTTSPNLSFMLNTSLFGYHRTSTKINQLNDEGINYKILKNGSIYWEFYHNLYMPSQYTDFEFEIFKPSNWRILEALDPTLQSRSFDGGEIGDEFLKINMDNAIFPGWWSFKATSPNYLNSSNIKLIKQGQWVSNANFTTGESTNISAQLDYKGMIPSNTSEINLIVYHPNGTIFFTESKFPSNGNVTFSQITFNSFNAIGGSYEYTLFWSNGTALGGLNSSFIVKHNSTLLLLKPNDAKLDLITEGLVGDIIPIRIFLKDAENNLSISDSLISYNWTDGTRYFDESALGIYETVLDTSDLLSRGLYNIVINSSKLGFFICNLTLEINLGEETNLQVLESDYNIELHANSTIIFKLTDFDGDPIDGALVDISIANPSLYTIKNPEDGVYNIEFSTVFINAIGIYQLSINFSAIAYEPQYYTYQFQIIQQSVNLSAYINYQQIYENAPIGTTFNEALNISARAISNIDEEFLSDGSITYISENYEKRLSENLDYWYNASIIFSPENFSLGINLVYLKFEHPNYRTATFGFQILINQIEINIDPVNFQDSINAEVGETITIQIRLLDPKTNASIENASMTYKWKYGLGTLNETSIGFYQAQVELPEGLNGTYTFDLIITPDGSTYETTQTSFVVVISEPIVDKPENPNYLLWSIIGILISIVGVLGALSYRTYFYMPKKRKIEAKLIAKTQRFKDIKNVQAIVVIHRLSGIPIYSQSYSILEKHKKELFSGFIQAITMIGEEFAEKDGIDGESTDKQKGYGVEKMMELDFKQFYCLIADIEDLRVVIILEERSSERLKEQLSHLILALNLKLSEELENWDGSLDKFQILIPEILNEYFELYYKDSFKLASNINLLTLKKDKNLSKMEMRVINVVQSISKDNIISNLNSIVDLVHEENKNLIIEAIESLIRQKIIIPLNN